MYMTGDMILVDLRGADRGGTRVWRSVRYDEDTDRYYILLRGEKVDVTDKQKRFVQRERIDGALVQHA